MAESLSAALGGALEFDPGPVPSTGPGLVRYVGSQREVVQALTGMTRAPRRGDYTSPAEFEAQRRRWRTAQRRVQRWGAAEGRQRRGLTKLAPLPPAVKRRLRREARVRQRREALRGGVRVRMLATVTVPSAGGRADDTRTRWMPAPPGPGVYLAGSTVAALLELPEPRRSVEFEETFLDEYGFDDGIILTVEALKVWPDAQAEPR